MVFTFSELENDPEDDREYIEWTFHECEPIKTKPLPNSLVAPFIIPYKPLSLTISQRFQLIYNENEDSEGLNEILKDYHAESLMITCLCNLLSNLLSNLLFLFR